MPKYSILAILALCATGCMSGAEPETVAAPPPSMHSAQPAGAASRTEGLVFAQRHCTACHAISAGGSSPNVEAPTFEAIVNTPGLTDETLQGWLRDSHNFPELMNFSIDSDQIDSLAAYMITLQRSDFMPPI